MGRPWTRGRPSTSGRPRTLADVLRRTAQLRGDRVALIEGDDATSWAAVDVAVDAVAAGLRARGLAPGDRVALALGTTTRGVQAYLAVARAGLVAVPVNTSLTTGEVARVLADSGARAVLASPPAVTQVRSAVAGVADALSDPPPELADRAVPDVVVSGTSALPGEATYEDLLAAPADPADDAVGGEELAVLLYTSGTSGRPRGAMLSHRALLANLEQIMAIEPVPVREDDVVLGLLPLFHVYGLNAVLGMAVRTGATVVLCPRFDAAEALRLVEERGVTNLPVAPPVLLSWVGRDDLAAALGSVRVVVSGAAALPASVVEEVTTATGVVVHEGYGLTEASPVVTTTMLSPRPRVGTVGRPLPGVDVRLVDDDGRAVEDGDPGEILVRGPNLFSGWWPDGEDAPGPDGWYATGDVAIWDDEGDLVLVDRVKELVIVSGFNVYPREVEEVLLEAPGVAEAAVIAVPHPRTGEAVKAFLVSEPGSAVTAESVLEYCRERLARFKRPTVVEFVDSLPHIGTGKVAKGQLREREKRAAGLV